ncbi:P27 family phage terminase small subunit [Amaricoccus sp.]|uniref:P27 family phage terminase small subunit n=1 Tax=Amaricoccus sp. TaxID=1872485 RepID=UPI0025BD820C|nr:P27 family phage terminase small subunit [Amaricoccus sp.]
MKEGPALYRTPNGHVQQSPWLGVANRQLELMGRFMVELGMTPAARSRVAVAETAASAEPLRIEIVTVCEDPPDPPAAAAPSQIGREGRQR